MSRRHRISRSVLLRRTLGNLGRQQKQGIALLIIGFVGLLFLLSFSRNLIPVMTEMAVNVAYELVTGAVNDAINERLLDGSLSYSQLISLEKDAAGQITALTTDMARINTLQATITNEVIHRVSELGASDLSIPLGNIIGGSLLSGRGPGIGFRVVSLGNPSANFSNAFSTAGINQTKHQIMLDLTITVNILVPGNATQESITTQVLVAETVIVGDVPSTYGHFHIANWE